MQNEFSVRPRGRRRMLVRDGSGQAKEHSPENKDGYIFIIKEKMGRGQDHLLPHFWVDIKAYIISSSLTLYGLTRTAMALFKSYVYHQKGGNID